MEYNNTMVFCIQGTRRHHCLHPYFHQWFQLHQKKEPVVQMDWLKPMEWWYLECCRYQWWAVLDMQQNLAPLAQSYEHLEIHHWLSNSVVVSIRTLQTRAQCFCYNLQLDTKVRVVLHHNHPNRVCVHRAVWFSCFDITQTNITKTDCSVMRFLLCFNCFKQLLPL